MGDLKTIGKNHFRIYCDCKKYMHEIYRDAEGNLVFESMMSNLKKPAGETDETLPPAPTVPAKPKKPKGGWSIFEEDEDEEGAKE